MFVVVGFGIAMAVGTAALLAGGGAGMFGLRVLVVFVVHNPADGARVKSLHFFPCPSLAKAFPTMGAAARPA